MARIIGADAHAADSLHFGGALAAGPGRRLLGVYFFYGFLVPVLAALVIGFASWPLYRKLLARVGGNTTIAATIAIIMIITFLVIPIGLAVTYTTGEVRTWVTWAIHANRA